jgi:hypothetical protein
MARLATLTLLGFLTGTSALATTTAPAAPATGAGNGADSWVIYLLLVGAVAAAVFWFARWRRGRSGP